MLYCVPDVGQMRSDGSHFIRAREVETLIATIGQLASAHGKIMSDDNPERLTPEEQELERKRADFASLESQLTQPELELATLQAEMSVFDIRYLRVVGSLYAELDELEAQIAEVLARIQPENHADQEHAAQARAQAQESADATGTAEVPKAQDIFHPSDDLKKLYRDVARHLHPDLATDEEDRVRRHGFMADVNQAYEEEDESRLRAILLEWESNPEAVEGLE